ncbi:hypothetical protein GpartN1_g5091.t1 [Galdieria partita]|uniref:Uncharacterized protein n=1 Tax=Galdieria partita TaxID=83374 RepID=A0A9C7US68_9RHOD|nr:hypothetical protein GpartN1_g5091.t1 [Galdieria partita]
MLVSRLFIRRHRQFWWRLGWRNFSNISETNNGGGFVVNSGTVTKVRWLRGAENLQSVQREKQDSSTVRKEQKLELTCTERFRRMRERSVVPYLLKRIQRLVGQQDLNGAWRALCILAAPGNKDVVESLDFQCISDMFRIFERNNEYESTCMFFGLLDRVGVTRRFSPVIYRWMILAHLKAGRPGSAIKLVVQKLAPLGDQDLEEILAAVAEAGQNEVTQRFLEKLKNENVSAVDSLSNIGHSTNEAGEEDKSLPNVRRGTGLKTAIQYSLRQSLKNSDMEGALHICEEYIKQDTSITGELALFLVQQLAKSKGYRCAYAALEVFRERFPELGSRELLENLTIGLSQRGQICSFGHYLSLQALFSERNSKALPGHLLFRTSTNPFSVHFVCETLHFNREGNIRRAFELSLERDKFTAALELFHEIVRFGYDRPSCFLSLFRSAVRVAKSSGGSNASMHVSSLEERLLALSFLKHPEPFVDLMAERNILDKHDAKILILDALNSGEMDFASFTLRERLLAKPSYSMEDYYLVQKVASVCKEMNLHDMRKKWLDISKEIFTPVSV